MGPVRRSGNGDVTALEPMASAVKSEHSTIGQSPPWRTGRGSRSGLMSHGRRWSTQWLAGAVSVCVGARAGRRSHGARAASSGAADGHAGQMSAAADACGIWCVTHSATACDVPDIAPAEVACRLAARIEEHDGHRRESAPACAGSFDIHQRIRRRTPSPTRVPAPDAHLAFEETEASDESTEPRPRRT